jgi:hypothetical protein
MELLNILSVRGLQYQLNYLEYAGTGSCRYATANLYESSGCILHVVKETCASVSTTLPPVVFGLSSRRHRSGWDLILSNHVEDSGSSPLQFLRRKLNHPPTAPFVAGLRH